MNDPDACHPPGVAQPRPRGCGWVRTASRCQLIEAAVSCQDLRRQDSSNLDFEKIWRPQTVPWRRRPLSPSQLRLFFFNPLLHPSLFFTYQSLVFKGYDPRTTSGGRVSTRISPTALGQSCLGPSVTGTAYTKQDDGHRFPATLRHCFVARRRDGDGPAPALAAAGLCASTGAGARDG